MITSCLRQLGSGSIHQPPMNNSSLMCTAHKATSQRHCASCPGTSNINFPNCKDSTVTCLLIPLGHGKWQHLDFKVNAKGRDLYLKMKDKQQILGRPEITFYVAGLLFPNCRSGFDPDWNTHTMTNSSERKLLHAPGKKAVWQPALSESPWHDYLSFIALFTGMFPNIWKWQKGTGSSLTCHHYYYFLHF